MHSTQLPIPRCPYFYRIASGATVNGVISASLYVLEILTEGYTNDAEAKRQKMSDEQRLQFHQKKSGPKLNALKTWLTEQIEERKVEPNSSLGEAIRSMLKHWEKLTLFLRSPGDQRFTFRVALDIVSKFRGRPICKNLRIPRN